MAYNINNPPGGTGGQSQIIQWLIYWVQWLWRRQNGLSGGSGVSSKVIPLFDYYTNAGNVGISETDLYSSTIAANQLATNGDKLEVMYAGTAIAGKNAVVDIYFGGHDIFTSTALNPAIPSPGTWVFYVTFIRVSSSSVRYVLSGLPGNNAGPGLSNSQGSSGTLTGLDLSGANVLKITGTSSGPGGANDDVVATMGSVSWISHA